jgi:hypothetical protein
MSFAVCLPHRAALPGIGTEPTESTPSGRHTTRTEIGRATTFGCERDLHWQGECATHCYERRSASPCRPVTYPNVPSTLGEPNVAALTVIGDQRSHPELTSEANCGIMIPRYHKEVVL